MTDDVPRVVQCIVPDCSKPHVGRVLVCLPVEALSGRGRVRLHALPTIEMDGRKLKVVSQTVACADHFDTMERVAETKRPKGSVVYVERGLVTKKFEDERIIH
jgi:hypothetical protein